MSLTGNKDTDFLLLLNIPDVDLPNFSCLNKYSEKLYSDPNFWRRKMMIRFNLYYPDILSIERYLGSIKDIYRYFTNKNMDLIIPILKDSKFIDELESIIRTILPNNLPKWVNSQLFIFELRKKMLIKSMSYIYWNNFYYEDVWLSLSPFKAPYKLKISDDRNYVKVSEYFSETCKFLYQTINGRI
jgi:hypothetical protein